MSFVEVSADSHFPLENLPYGVFSTPSKAARVGVAIGDYILDLSEVSHLFSGPLIDQQVAKRVFSAGRLNAFMSLSCDAWAEVRLRISQLLSRDCPDLQVDASLRSRALIPASDASLHLPVEIGDYTDFYASLHHASNVGAMFRPGAEPLLPNWRHLPVAYHGRASSVVVSGTPIQRPVGQTKPDNVDQPIFGPCRALDFELEMGIFIGGTPSDSPPGSRIPINDAEKYIFGFCLLNDWSARDVQKWEYIPLGPFLSKNFATSISPWVVPLAALKPCVFPNTVQTPPVLDYLKHEDDFNFDIDLTVNLTTPELSNTNIEICRSNFKNLYWTPKQMVAHHAVTGCNLRPGDLLGTGTISGPTKESRGCLLELSWKGDTPLDLGGGVKRTYLKDGDEVSLSGYAAHPSGVKIGFGSCTGKVLPAAVE